MNSERIYRFHDVLLNIMKLSTKAWVYLPIDRNWSLESDSAVLESEEVPPEMEDEVDAGVPLFARDHNLMQVLPVSYMQQVVSNAKMQKPDVTEEELFDAFMFYYNRDAFIEL